jgi:hypothetical protein
VPIRRSRSGFAGQYHTVVKAQAAKIRLNRETLRLAFDDLVLPDGLLDQLGPSLIGHQSLFLYGGTGNGKTSIAERILRIYKDTVLVPYAVEVDGHIVNFRPGGASRGSRRR